MGMDATGARLLAARIAAGVRIGAVIELVADSGADLRAGDRGVVREFDATGAVESAELIEGFEPFYNRMVLAAVKSWAFQPARLDGVPVRFRKRIQIVVSPEQ